MDEFEEPQWDVPGWDWHPNDHSWLSSESGVHKDGVSIFFIHGGRVRHQGHLPYGTHPVEEFVAKLRELADDLDDPHVVWCEDTGAGDCGLWVEGTRPPNEDDLERLRHARSVQARQDEMTARDLRRRRPELFKA